MTTVNVILTPGVDTDQTVSARNQVAAAPNGTLGSPTIVNMPAGRYRIDGNLGISNKSHIRWTCLAGAQTYPNASSDSQAFVAYTDMSSYAAGLGARRHITMSNCTNVIGSFMRVDGPNLQRWTDYPLYAMYRGAGYEAESAFAILNGCVDSGWVDCSWDNVYGDGLYAGGQNGGIANADCFVTRMTGIHAGRHNMCPVNVDGFVVTDFTGDYSGYSGIDIEPNSALERSWNIQLIRMNLGSRVYAFSLTGGSPTKPSKKNISLIDCSVIRMAHVAKMGLICRQEAGGLLLVDGFTDIRNNNVVGLDCSGPWDNITIRNCRVRSGINTAPSYAVRAWALNAVTITDNNFNGTSNTEGFDNLVTFTATPASYTHYGNVWAMGTQNDGTAPVPPTALFATSNDIALVGGTATLTMVAAPPPVGPPPAAYFGAFIGGAPFRLRSSKGWGRMRGVAGTRLRGSQGPAERHPMRLRSPNGRGRLRSANYPSYLRSQEPIAVPAHQLSATTGSVAVHGSVSGLSTKLVATSGHLSLAGSTATITIVNTVIVLPAVSNDITVAGGEQTATFRHAATSGTLTLAGSVTHLNKTLPETSAQIVLAGGTALLSVRLAAESAQIALAGSSAGLNGAVNFTATSGHLALAGGTATLSIRTAATTSGQVAIQGGTATLLLGGLLHATPGELAILGGQASLHILHRVGTGTITLQGGTAELGGTDNSDFAVTAGQIHINGGTAHLNTYNQYPEWPMGTQAPEWEMADA